MMFHAVSGLGNSETASSAQHSLSAKIWKDTRPIRWGIMATVFSGAFIVVLIFVPPFVRLQMGISITRPMQILGILAGLALPAGASALTLTTLGAPSAEHPEGISLRDDSRRGGGFFVWYGRSHTGGGLRGGK
jgi:hypothetical protein